MQSSRRTRALQQHGVELDKAAAERWQAAVPKASRNVVPGCRGIAGHDVLASQTVSASLQKAASDSGDHCLAVAKQGCSSAGYTTLAAISAACIANSILSSGRSAFLGQAAATTHLDGSSKQMSVVRQPGGKGRTIVEGIRLCSFTSLKLRLERADCVPELQDDLFFRGKFQIFAFPDLLHGQAALQDRSTIEWYSGGAPASPFCRLRCDHKQSVIRRRLSRHYICYCSHLPVRPADGCHAL